MSKANKKKSAKEKRVLAGALCIAAVIAAGSTFAWFTSSDEVTNRLSANADYNVQIVESFTPPNNWIPGQEVKKDVYATNTGNIGAFVREEISGALTITKEKATPTLTADSIKLSAEERYVMEAGSFLAYKPATSAKVLGDQIVIRPDDAEGTALTDFKPDVEGLYVFRRSIAVAGDRTETFEYAGYYYKNDEFYKISNLNVTPDTTPDNSGDGVKTDGNLASASAGFFEEETKVINPVDLIYKDTTNLTDADADYKAGYVGKYLIASYDTGNYKAQAALASAAAAYDEAIHNYEYLSALLTAATNEATAAGEGTGELGTANTALNAKQAALTTAINVVKDAQDAVDDAQVALNDAISNQEYWDAAVKASKVKLYGNENGSDSNYTADSLYGKLQAAQTAVTNSGTATDTARFEQELDAWVTTNAGTLSGRTRTGTGANALTVADLEKFKADLSDTDEKHDFYVASANKQIAQLNYDTELAVYNAANSSLTTATSALGTDTDASSANTAYGKLKKAQEDLATAQTNLATAQREYNDAYDAWLAAAEKSATASKYKDEIEAAKNAAQTARDAAQTEYNSKSNESTLKESDGVLKIYIKLSDNVITAQTDPVSIEKWQMLPNSVANNVATFYYTSILDAGETSTRLIESVELDKNATQDMYKSFDFDLNVGLKSAQITYSDDQATILADATPSELDAIATLDAPTNIDTAITWSKATPNP